VVAYNPVAVAGTSGGGLLAAAGSGGLAARFDGRVTIGGNLSVSGDASKPGGGSWSVLSDVRLKKRIQPINGALRQLLQLRGVSYEYNNPSVVGELPGTHIGMVAQDVEQVFPSWVDRGQDGYKRLTFRGFEAIAVEAIRDLESETDERAAALESRIAQLEKLNEELRAALASINDRLTKKK
jgi:hypothetical protein